MSRKLAGAFKIALWATVAALFGFIGWSAATFERDVEVSRRREPYVLVGINPPKHFYVDLKDARGEVHERQYVSKHCNSWRRLAIGQTLDLEVVTYRRPAYAGSRTYDKIQTRSDAVCPRG